LNLGNKKVHVPKYEVAKSDQINHTTITTTATTTFTSILLASANHLHEKKTFSSRKSEQLAYFFAKEATVLFYASFFPPF